jgi:transcriptional regulator with XRE-family HTH domain
MCMTRASAPRARHLLGNDLVREARKRAGLTQRELAERTGTTQSAIARLESGRTAPSFENVLALVRACGYDLDVMLVARDDADMLQADNLGALTPAARVARHQRVSRQLGELRRAGQKARDGVG